MKPADRQRARSLRNLPTFRGPRRTLILFDPWLEMWLVAGWDGGEVLIPEADLAAFLEHCAEHLPRRRQDDTTRTSEREPTDGGHLR